MRPGFHRFSKRGFSGPSTLKSLPDSGSWNTCSTRPFCRTQQLAIILYHEIARLIAVLLGRGGPPHVSRLVVSVIIGESIQAVLYRWPAPHVFQEVCESVISGPPLTYSNSSAAISVVAGGLGVVALCEHVRPCSPLRTSTHPMFSVPCTTYFPPQTSTAICVALHKPTSTYHKIGSTFAGAAPSDAAIFIAPGRGVRCKSPKLTSVQV